MFYTSFWKIGASVFTSKKYMSLKHKLVNNFVTNRDKVVPLPHSGLLTSRPGSGTILCAFSKFKQCVKVSTTK